MGKRSVPSGSSIRLARAGDLPVFGPLISFSGLPMSLT
jgi:hypothetical protein